MSDRDDDNNNDQRDDDKQQGGQDGTNSGINKYFGKANKPLKFFNPKIKKNFKSGNLKNLSLTFQSNPKGVKQLQNIHQKTKAKLQYRWSSNYFQVKPKLRINFTPYNYYINFPTKCFQEAVLNWKRVYNKFEEQNFQFKLNDKRNLQLKYKRMKFLYDKKLKFKLDTDMIIDQMFKVKNGIGLETVVKIPEFESHKYLNTAEFKNKLSVKDFYVQNFMNTGIWKVDLSQKFTFLINKYKLKQQSKLSYSIGGKDSGEFKSNLELTNDSNIWTAYGSLTGYKWGVEFDEVKFIYSVYDKWKVGCMYGKKGWELILNNSELSSRFCTNFGLYLSNKNYTVILKNKVKMAIGKVNYQIALQNALYNKDLSKVNLGLTLNINS